jgi:acetyl/propionyl-CoA carboxylase alpha subunit
MAAARRRGEKLPLRRSSFASAATRSRRASTPRTRRAISCRRSARWSHLRQPAKRPHVRVDTGVRQGDAITPNYDPMIAKLIVWGEDRAAAVRRLAGALAAYEVVGVQTNLGGVAARDRTAHPAGMTLRVDGVLYRLRVVRHNNEMVVIQRGRNHVVHVIDPLAPPRREDIGSDLVTAPIPARIARILVEPGAIVRKGAPLIVLEAMKMELTLYAPADGTVAALRHAVDDMVEEGTELVTFVTPHTADPKPA